MSLTKIVSQMLQSDLPFSILNHAPINVLDYGAIGDGEHDDTSALCAASLAASSVGGNLYFPPLTYRVTGSILVYSNMNIIGYGATIEADTGTYGSGGAGNGIFTNAVTDEVLSSVRIEGFRINVNRETYHGVYLWSSLGMADLTMRSLTIYNPQWDGILCHGNIGGAGNDESWISTKPSNRRYRVENCKCVNEDRDNTTRTGIMVEEVYDANIVNCYVTGFHTGIHIEGSADINISGCWCEDNNGDKIEPSNYQGDYMIGRSSNVSMIGCKSRRVNAPEDNPYFGTRYRCFNLPSTFQDGLEVVGCSFVGGNIYTNEMGSTTTTTKLGISFSDCNFASVDFSFSRQSSGQYMEGFSIVGCTFRECYLAITQARGFQISNNTFISPSTASLDLGTCYQGSVTGNTFKGGNVDDATRWKRAQVILSACSEVVVSNNTFLIDSTYTGGEFCIGLYANNYCIFNNNTFNKTAGFAIYETYQTLTPCLYCSGSLNIFYYSTSSDEKGVLLNDASCIKVNNITV